MGLDAAVFLNIKEVAANVPVDRLSVDQFTGEAYFSDDEVAHEYPGVIFKALDRRLGNVAALAEILEEISVVSPPDSILRGKILQSFSHSGDVIGYNELETLEHEINLLKKQTADTSSPALNEFVKALEELIAAAREQENPIVFM